jgi:hypothetical protein
LGEDRGFRRRPVGIFKGLDMENVSQRSNPPAVPLDAPEPRWPASVAVAAFALLYLALPRSLAVGPWWLAPAVVLVLLAGSIASHARSLTKLNHLIGTSISTVLTLFLLWSLALLVRALPAHTETPVKLLISAVALWMSNVLVFAVWYWRLDAGGPNGRDQRAGHPKGAFLFPQMTSEGRQAWLEPVALVDTAPGKEAKKVLWSPQFADYLFLAFNTSTAFSPTDSPVLSRWAKVLTMVQSTISLAVIAILAARAVNIL